MGESKVFAGLEAGNKVLKELHDSMPVEAVERVLDDQRELVDHHSEISSLLGGSISSVEEEDLEAELAQLELELNGVADAQQSVRGAEDTAPKTSIAALADRTEE